MADTRSRPLRTLLTCILALAPAAAALAEIRGPAQVMDGDTFDIGVIRIRLHGVDAPELAQRCASPSGGEWECGAAAARRLEALTADGDVACLGREHDAYGRVIATCMSGGLDIAAVLVEEGLAWAFVEYSDDYAGPEAVAREAGQGIWQAPTQAAWDYRADRWVRAAAEAPRQNCPIKGNISAAGERIYHTPWSNYYSRTRIDEGQGEAWFCDEAEAEAAGWRPASGR
jgi:endonuclease YncB( thermonuclease family)